MTKDFFPLPDTGLPALEDLLNGHLWARWAERGKVFPLTDLRHSVRYVRLKPGVSCRLTVFGEGTAGPDDPPPGFLLKLFPDPEHARGAFRKQQTRVHLIGKAGYEPFLSLDPPVLALPFPNDPEIPVLRSVYEPARFRRTLMASLSHFPEQDWRIKKGNIGSDLIAYKPGRRAVYRLRIHLRHRRQAEKAAVQIHAKLSNEATIAKSRARLRAVYESIPDDADWRTPQPLGIVESGRFFACEWLEGTSLERYAIEPRSDAPEVFRQVGRCLAQLHSLNLKLEARSAEGEAEQVRSLSVDLAGLLPSSKSTILQIGEKLAAALSRLGKLSLTLIHGDFHLGQILMVDGTPCFVDFDRAGKGPAVLDVGSLHAHLLELNAPSELSAAFDAGYASVSGPLPGDQVRLGTAITVFRRAVIPFRSLDPKWPDETLGRIRMVENLLSAPEDHLVRRSRRSRPEGPLG